MTPIHALPAALNAGAFPFRAGPAFCATLVAANSTPRRPTPGLGQRPAVTRAEIATLFARELYAAA
jgi:hypothetical protein